MARGNRKGRRRGIDGNTVTCWFAEVSFVVFFPFFPGREQGEDGRGNELTREAYSLRVTMIMGQTGRYLESRRAVRPL